jgi:hypothetical protein
VKKVHMSPEAGVPAILALDGPAEHADGHRRLIAVKEQAR